MKIAIITAILLPIIGGITAGFLKFKDGKIGAKAKREILIISVLVANCIPVWYLILKGQQYSFKFLEFADKIYFKFKIDAVGSMFAGLVSILWIFASIYAFEYIEHEKKGHHRSRRAIEVFYMYYTVTYGVVIGLAFSGNLFTMFMFFELLSLITAPLVIFTLEEKAIRAGHKYLQYMLGGAAFGFIGMIAMIIYGNSLDFTYGGYGFVPEASENINLLLFIFVLAFCGFGVKAAIFPFSRWIIYASAAPTPVTGLLHAVAVVKGGAFAVIRLTYYTFGTEIIKGTWAQWVVIGLSLLTILYGSLMALKERHLKRRLAYSTISNLSYILFGIALMSPLGLFGALCHFVMHAVTKLCAFFCAGSFMQAADKEYVDEFGCIGRKMKATGAAFMVSALSLVGIPMFAGFISKWELAKAAFEGQEVITVIGFAVLLISAFLTAIYMFSFGINIYNSKAGETEIVSKMRGNERTVVIILAAAIILLGCFSGGLTSWLYEAACGNI